MGLLKDGFTVDEFLAAHEDYIEDWNPGIQDFDIYSSGYDCEGAYFVDEHMVKKC